MPAKTFTDLGAIVIDDNVIATIAGVSAMESYGIVGMASKNAADGIFELLKWDNLSKGIKVFSKDNKLSIDLHVMISVVAENIIERVKFNVEKLTGYTVDNINVHVQGIRVGK